MMGSETMTALKRLRASDRIKELEGRVVSLALDCSMMASRCVVLEEALREIMERTEPPWTDYSIRETCRIARAALAGKE